MRKLKTNLIPEISESQRALATALGINIEEGMAISKLVLQIEQKLGDGAQLESARWYVMSVMRHVENAQWTQLEISGLTQDEQYDLAARCLADSEFTQSIKTVLKGANCRFALVDFKRTRNPGKRILTNTTLAFRIAEAAVNDMLPVAVNNSEKAVVDQVQIAATSSEAEVVDQAHVDLSEEPTTASRRRASRRGYAGETATKTATSNDTGEGAQSVAGPGMSPQEYAELEAALTQQQSSARLRRTWLRFGSDESRSWLLGLLAGFILFGAVLLLFL